MQPFPPTYDLKRFEGDSIVQVSLDPHGVQFNFESGLLIAVEYRIEQVEPDGSRFHTNVLRETDRRLCSIDSFTVALRLSADAI